MSTWTAPITFAASNALTAAQLNAEVRDHALFLKGALDLISNSTTADTGTAMFLQITRAATTDPVLRGLVSGDTVPRWRVDANGRTVFGSGSATGDIAMYRNAAGNLLVDSGGGALTTKFEVQSTVGQASIIDVDVAGDTNPRMRLWGSLTNGGKLDFSDGSSSADTNLYRAAANTLKTDDHIIAVDGLQTKVVAGVVSDGSFTVTPASGTIAIDTTNSQIYVRIGSTWKKTVALT